MEKTMKEEVVKTENYILIDVLKFFCAIFVVGIHTGIVNNKDSTAEWYILHMVFISFNCSDNYRILGSKKKKIKYCISC